MKSGLESSEFIIPFRKCFCIGNRHWIRWPVQYGLPGLEQVPDSVVLDFEKGVDRGDAQDSVTINVGMLQWQECAKLDGAEGIIMRKFQQKRIVTALQDSLALNDHKEAMHENRVCSLKFKEVNIRGFIGIEDFEFILDAL